MGNATSRPRVVLVEDDAALRRFVQLALEELDITLVECTQVDEALAALRAAPARLVLTDLGLCKASGLTLIEQLEQDAALRGDARVVVLSAGITPEIRERLHELRVWRVLPKPVPLHELEQCVREALRQEAPVAPPTATGLDTPCPDDEASAVALNFGGDLDLYRAFRDTCVAQFPLDVDTGDEACQRGDAQALRRVAHNLKTVLRSLGHGPIGDRAAQIERLAAAGELAGAADAWAEVRDPLLQLARHRP